MSSDQSDFDLWELTEDKSPIDEIKEKVLNKQEPKQETSLAVNQDSFLMEAMGRAGVAVPMEKTRLLQGFMNKSARGHQSALPMKCKGTECPFLHWCPLYAASIQLPTGKSCPVEEALIEKWVHKNAEALEIDPDDPEHAVDLEMVYELAGLELIRMRAANHLAEKSSLVEEKIVGYSPQGDPIYDEKPAMSLLILEKNSKLVSKIREQLVATRRAQIQAGKFAGDPSIKAASMMEKARKIAQRRSQGENITDVDFEVKE
jgi:hypothetical protein